MILKLVMYQSHSPDRITEEVARGEEESGVITLSGQNQCQTCSFPLLFWVDLHQ